MYFLANDPRVPRGIHESVGRPGLAGGEFVDHGNWSYQLYVREARRMIGRHVTTEHDILSRHGTSQAVAMGSYPIDSHNVQRYVTNEGFVQNEGHISIRPSQPYGIALGPLAPMPSECTNLIVPVCLSSSHAACGSIRTEPVLMILCHSAAALAALAINGKCAVQDVDYSALRQNLLNSGQILPR